MSKDIDKIDAELEQTMKWVKWIVLALGIPLILALWLGIAYLALDVWRAIP